MNFSSPNFSFDFFFFLIFIFLMNFFLWEEKIAEKMATLFWQYIFYAIFIFIFLETSEQNRSKTEFFIELWWYCVRFSKNIEYKINHFSKTKNQGNYFSIGFTILRIFTYKNYLGHFWGEGEGVGWGEGGLYAHC